MVELSLQYSYHFWLQSSAGAHDAIDARKIIIVEMSMLGHCKRD